MKKMFLTSYELILSNITKHQLKRKQAKPQIQIKPKNIINNALGAKKYG